MVLIYSFIITNLNVSLMTAEFFNFNHLIHSRASDGFSLRY